MKFFLRPDSIQLMGPGEKAGNFPVGYAIHSCSVQFLVGAVITGNEEPGMGQLFR